MRQRAASLCEYCHTDEHWQLIPFTVDHVLPAALGGGDTADNFALARFHRNRYKSGRQSAFGPETQYEVPLFNPRRMAWAGQFIWSADGLRILPRSEIGRAAVELLNLNRERILRIRQDDVAANRRPPAADPREGS